MVLLQWPIDRKIKLVNLCRQQYKNCKFSEIPTGGLYDIVFLNV